MLPVTESTQLTAAALRRNLGLNCIHEASWGFGVAFHNTYAVLPLFLHMLGAPQGVVVSLAGLFSILCAVPQLLTAVLGRNLRNMRLAVIAVHGLILPPLLAAGFTFAFLLPSGPSVWIFYYICFIFYGLAIGMVIPIWTDFLRYVIPGRRRGTFLGLSFAMNSLGGFLGGLAFKRLMAGTLPFPENFGWGFLITCGSLTVGTVVFAFYRMAPPPESRSPKTIAEFWQDTWEIIREHVNFRRYILARVLFTSNFPAVSLYAVYAQQRFGFDISTAGLFTAANTLAFGLASYTAGRLGDRWGHKTALTLALAAQVLALVCALLARSMGWVYAIFFLLGMGQGAFFPSAMSLVYEFAGPRDNKTYMALIDTSMAPFTLLFILLAGSLSPLVPIPWILSGIGLLMTFSILVLIFTVHDPGMAVPRLTGGWWLRKS